MQPCERCKRRSRSRFGYVHEEVAIFHRCVQQSAQRVRTKLHVYTRTTHATPTSRLQNYCYRPRDAADATPATAMAPSFRWLAAALLAATATAQFPGMPGGPPADARPIFKSGKYLGCTVCKLAVEEIWKEALRLREEAPYKKPSEDMYQDSIAQICDPIKDLGEWVAMYDVTQSERGAPLRMEKQEYMCECRRECRTIQKACENIINEHMEDMAESLYKRDAASLEKFSNRVCTKWAEACPSKTPKTYLHPNEHFMPLDEEMWRMRRMQDVINDQAKKHKKQPVQFVDPMQSAYFGDDEDFEPDEL